MVFSLLEELGTGVFNSIVKDKRWQIHWQDAVLCICLFMWFHIFSLLFLPRLHSSSFFSVVVLLACLWHQIFTPFALLLLLLFCKIWPLLKACYTENRRGTVSFLDGTTVQNVYYFYYFLNVLQKIAYYYSVCLCLLGNPLKQHQAWFRSLTNNIHWISLQNTY